MIVHQAEMPAGYIATPPKKLKFFVIGEMSYNDEDSALIIKWFWDKNVYTVARLSFVYFHNIFSQSKMILLTKLNRPQNDHLARA